MTIASDAMSDSALEPQAPAAPAKTRPFYWSVRRELWENRAIYLAPLIAAGVVLFGAVVGMLNPPHMTRTERVGAVVRHAPLHVPPIALYLFGGGVILVTGLIVGVFYCLGALHNERRDRSILFWKSLPVSDLTTVLSKATLPLVILPLVTFVAIAATQLLMMLLSSAIMLAHGQDAATLWANVALPHLWGLFLYGLVALALWHAPVWGWLLLVSSWAKRTTFLWAVGPPLAACVVERMAFSTSYIWSLVTYRLLGGLGEAFTDTPHGQNEFVLPHMDPAKFLVTPGLWVGLGFAAAFLVGAVWMRRRREPI